MVHVLTAAEHTPWPTRDCTQGSCRQILVRHALPMFRRISNRFFQDLVSEQCVIACLTSVPKVEQALFSWGLEGSTAEFVETHTSDSETACSNTSGSFRYPFARTSCISLSIDHSTTHTRPPNSPFQAVSVVVFFFGDIPWFLHHLSLCQSRCFLLSLSKQKCFP